MLMARQKIGTEHKTKNASAICTAGVPQKQPAFRLDNRSVEKHFQ
jgi:hypothetical protein